MAKKVEVSREALAELTESIDWYAARSVNAAMEFASAVEDALGRISVSPDSFPLTFAGCRYCALRRYPFQVVYRDFGDRLIVVAIAHGKRRPGYWRKRL